MALMLPGALTSQISGSIGGHTHGRTKGGPSVRNKPYSPLKQTPLQKAQHQKFGNLAAQYKSLTAAQRAGFKAGASTFANKNRFGVANTISGQSLFNKLNANLALIGGGVLTSMPVIVNPTPVPITGIDHAGGLPNIEVLFAGGITAGDTLVIFCTPLMSVGSQTYESKLRFMTTATNPATSKNFTTQFFLTFGQTVGIGMAVWVRIYTINQSCGVASTYSDMQWIIS